MCQTSFKAPVDAFAAASWDVISSSKGNNIKVKKIWWTNMKNLTMLFGSWEKELLKLGTLIKGDPISGKGWIKEEGEEWLVSLLADKINIGDIMHGRELALKQRELEAGAEKMNQEKLSGCRRSTCSTCRKSNAFLDPEHSESSCCFAGTKGEQSDHACKEEQRVIDDTPIITIPRITEALGIIQSCNQMAKHIIQTIPGLHQHAMHNHTPGILLVPEVIPSVPPTQAPVQTYYLIPSRA